MPRPPRTQGLTPSRISFWLGPAGTCTALHHDPASVLYVQIRGQKRFRMLAPSNEPALMSALRTYPEPELDLDQAAKDAGDRVYDVVLSPGEAMLLPAGWWHEVTALSSSISLSITSLKGPSSFSWFTPGEAGNEQVTLGDR
ncbi:MAG: hypothetical protein GY822_19725 [Deltaproteobacteria bacterium]|nr:hypothetical protein [Deltaproteobacteria bacterium]